MDEIFAMLQSLLWTLVRPFVDFLLGFLPDGDPQVYAIIDGIGGVGADLSFNVFYFVDWLAVSACIGVLVSVVMICAVAKFVLKGMDMGHKAIESIPVVE